MAKSRKIHARCYFDAMFIHIFGEMAEWLKATVLKTVEGNALREFESHSLRHPPSLLLALSRQ
jgi:hypothetical protein